jgi:hypothetical protein
MIPAIIGATLMIMSSLSLQDLGLKASLLKAVGKKAKHEGKTLPEYVRWLIERDMLADKSFDEILKPVRADFHKSGITEDQLDEIVERARNPPYRKASRTRR